MRKIGVSGLADIERIEEADISRIKSYYGGTIIATYSIIT